VCQFDHPGALAVTTPRGTWPFAVAPLRAATVQVRHDIPQCVVGAVVWYFDIRSGWPAAPTVGGDIGTSLIIVQRLLKGAMPGLPRIGFQVVDVRDTADLHLMVMTAPQAAGGRYLASGEFIWFEDMARILREEVPDLAAKVPTRRLPDWLLQVVALVDPQARGIRGELGRTRRVSAEASLDLGWRPRPLRETLADSARSLVAMGAIQG
jgi:nucleoside-diphosphate-sugar epimerase